MNTIEKLDKKECSGCSSCFQKCPKNAIVMKENDEGFLYPIIDKEKCIDCGLCSQVCPQLKELRKADTNYPKAYAMYNKNDEEILKSSSGGIFSVIANYVLSENGVVFGAAYDKEQNVKHIRVVNKTDLDLLRSSKYVQSNINDTFIKAEEDLKKGKLVLFTGTPCQIAGLNSYLIKTYDNLLTCDFVCHGVPSQKLFNVYLKYLSNKFKSQVKSYNFRSKSKYGWGLFAEVITNDNKIHYIKADFDPYYSNFLNCNTYRESCYRCHYSTYNRISNLTLADYWGVSSIHPKFYSEKGISLILVNDKKGENVIENVLTDIVKIDTDLNYAASKNKNLIRPSNRPQIRDKVYNNIYSDDEITYVKKNLKVNYNFKKIVKMCIPIRMQNYLKKLRGMKNK